MVVTPFIIKCLEPVQFYVRRVSNTSEVPLKDVDVSVVEYKQAVITLKLRVLVNAETAELLVLLDQLFQMRNLVRFKSIDRCCHI